MKLEKVISMKTRILFFGLVLLSTIISTPTFAEDVKIDLPAFSKISLRIPATLHIKQGSTQNVRIEAKSSTIDDIITEVKDRTLNIRFPNKNLFKDYNPGNIEIYITVPEIDALTVSGSGDIIGKEINSRIITLTVSGSGDINIGKLENERIKASISGSGNIIIEEGGRVADEFDINISGSGNVKADNFEATEVEVRMAGSGSCYFTSNGSIKARIAGSGNVNYKGNPSIDSSVVGSGKVNEM